MKVITAIKLAYLYYLYWVVGLDEEGFQESKANYLFELERFSAAAKAYQRALSGTTSPRLHGNLGYCYLNLGFPDKALQSFNSALERKADPVHEIGLAWAHLGLGDVSSCEALVARLRRDNGAPDAWVSNQLGELDIRLRESRTNEDARS
jgi:tetratricopeptide (TPR) repeat protein